MSKKLKAYQVQEEYGEANAIIIFADKNVVARLEGAEELNAEFGHVSCKRAEWADRYTSHDEIPIKEFLDHDWWFECSNCGSYITKEENLNYFINSENMPFCNIHCHNKYIERFGTEA